jgi:hypothetical protein
VASRDYRDRLEHAHLSAVDTDGNLPTISRLWGCLAKWRGSFVENILRTGHIGIDGHHVFRLPEDARWNAERQAVEFGVEIGDVGSGATARVPTAIAGFSGLDCWIGFRK